MVLGHYRVHAVHISGQLHFADLFRLGGAPPFFCSIDDSKGQKKMLKRIAANKWDFSSPEFDKASEAAKVSPELLDASSDLFRISLKCCWFLILSAE